MVLTTKARWELKEVRRGVAIYRRAKRTGTACGSWLAAGLQCDSLRQAREQVDLIPDQNIKHYLYENESLS